jgi:hypothetical protein
VSNKSLPTVTSDIPRDLRTFIDRVREILSSDNTNRFVTAQELASTGVVATTSTGALTNPANVVQISSPAAPGTITATAAIQNIIVEWNPPKYTGHAYAEVWGNSTNNLGTAVKVGVAPGNSYVDSVGPSVTRFYWVRFISVLNVEGPFNSVSGTSATTGAAVDYLLDTLTGQITTSQLYADLATQIGQIAGNTTAVQTLTTVVNGVSGSYTVKVDNNGYVAGYGLASTANNATPFSEFAIRADRFYVASPSGPGITPIVPFIVNTTTQTVNGVSVPAGVYMDAAFIKNGTITNAKIGNAAIDDAKIANLSAAKITSGYIDAARIQAGSLDAKIANIDAAVIGSGTINSARIGSISANSITTGTLSADRIGAGSASVGSGYSFILGSGQTLNGYPAAVGGTNSNSSGMGIAGYITSTGSNGWGATTGATVASNGLGGAFYNATNTSFNSFYTFGGLAQGSWGGSFIYHRSPGTINNGTLPPHAIAYGGTGDNGVYTSYWGPSASNRLTEAFLANQTTGFAAVFRKYTSGVSLVTEANLCTGNYSYYSTAGAVYANAGYLPFTGSHDGLVYRTATFEAGDIVIDAEVLAKLDISNSVVRFDKSSTPNQKGVIGVFVQSFEETPADWNPAIEMPDPHYGAYETSPDEPLINSAAYDVPADMKVAHINALGEGLINVCGEGGTIEKGDLIVTSSIPGKGMKQADDLVRNITVAKARETVTFSSPTEVKQIACIYMCG